MVSVSEKFVSFVKDTFFIEPRYIIQQNYKDTWNYVHANICHSQIYDHFNGICYVGFAVKDTPVNYVIFDLDRHYGESLKNLKNRYRSITSIFGLPNIVSKSPGTGIHSYYILDKAYHPNQLKDSIEEHINIEQSKVELFPCGKGLRLFGGEDCPLLSNLTLKPITNTSSQIEEHFTQTWQHSDRLKFDQYLIKSQIPPTSYSYKFKSEIRTLISEGLKNTGTRNISLRKINWAIQTYENFTKQEAQEFMRDWIEKKNNGKSKDWDNDRQKVYREIKELALRYNPSKVKRVKRFSLEKLSFEKILIIQDLANDISKSTDLDAMKVEEFLQYLISYGLENHDNGLIDIPSSVFKACKNGSRARYIKYKSALIDHGILTLVKNYSTVSNKCATYRIRDELLK